MKQLKLKSLILISVFIMSASAIANDRYINYDGQGVWTTESNTPAVKVYIQGASVYAGIIAQNNNIELPPIRLKRVNSNLLNEYTDHFIRIQDFNNDGWQDVAILKSAGYGTSTLCYSVFEYQPDFYSYSPHASKTICID